MATEEFTFPIISNDTSPATIDSPPLWRLSPATSPDPYHQRKDEEKFLYKVQPKGCIQRKSCSDIPNPNSDQEEDEEEEKEKMDVLWEDFNEELYKAKSTDLKEYNEFSNDMVEMGCVQALKLSSSSSSQATSKANGVIISSSSSKNGNGNKAGNMVVFMKVLKKLFLLQHHQQQHHNRSIKVRDVKWRTL